MTTIHFEHNLDDNESAERRMVRLVEVYAPRFMRIGGGSLGGNESQIKRKAPVRTTPEQRAQILELARTGNIHQTAIARMVGVSQSSVWHLLRKMGIRCPDARKDFGCPAHKAK